MKTEDIVQKIIENSKNDKMNFRLEFWKWLDEKEIRELVNQQILRLMKEQGISEWDITINGGGESSVFIIGNQVLKVSKRPQENFRSIPIHPLILQPNLELKVQSVEQGKGYMIRTFDKVDIPKLITLDDCLAIWDELLNDNIIFGDAFPKNIGKKTSSNEWVVIDADNVCYKGESPDSDYAAEETDVKLRELANLVRSYYYVAKNQGKELTQDEYDKFITEAMKIVFEEPKKGEITPEEAARNALKETTAGEANKAAIVEMNPENDIEKGETKSGQ